MYDNEIVAMLKKWRKGNPYLLEMYTERDFSWSPVIKISNSNAGGP